MDKVMDMRGTQVAQSVKPLSLGFGSGHDLVVHGIEPQVRLCTDSMEPAWDSLSLSLCPSPLVLSLSQKYINIFYKVMAVNKMIIQMLSSKYLFSVKSEKFEAHPCAARQPGWEPSCRLGHLQALRHWASYLTSLYFSCIVQTGTILLG